MSATPGTVTITPEYSALVDDCADELLRAARLLTGDWIQAEELLQETLAATLAHWDPHRGLQAARVGLQQELIATFLDRIPVADHLAATAPPAGETTNVLDALPRLAPLDRAAVVARYYLDLADTQAATALAIDSSQVRLIASRGLLRLYQRNLPTATPHHS